MTNIIKELEEGELDQVSGGAAVGIWPLPFPLITLPIPRLPTPSPVPFPIPRLPIEVK